MRRSVATGCCRASRSMDASSSSRWSASICSSAAMTLSARCRSASSRAVVARLMADPTSRVISTSWSRDRGRAPRGRRRAWAPGPLAYGSVSRAGRRRAGCSQPRAGACQRGMNGPGPAGEHQAKRRVGGARDVPERARSAVRTLATVDATLAAGLAGVVGPVARRRGGAVRPAVRASPATACRRAPEPGAAARASLDVLAVLRSSAIVLDTADAVVKASPPAYAYGLVRGARADPRRAASTWPARSAGTA